MPLEIPLKEMSLSDKMELLEALWDNLSSKPEELHSPDWHKDILDERRRLVQSGAETFSDWETAKIELRAQIP